METAAGTGQVKNAKEEGAGDSKIRERMATPEPHLSSSGLPVGLTIQIAEKNMHSTKKVVKKGKKKTAKSAISATNVQQSQQSSPAGVVVGGGTSTAPKLRKQGKKQSAKNNEETKQQPGSNISSAAAVVALGIPNKAITSMQFAADGGSALTSGGGGAIGGRMGTLKQQNTFLDGDIDDIDDTEEKTPLDIKAEVSRKQFICNPLIRDKGSVFNGGKLAPQDEGLLIQFMRRKSTFKEKQQRNLSARIASPERIGFGLLTLQQPLDSGCQIAADGTKQQDCENQRESNAFLKRSSAPHSLSMMALQHDDDNKNDAAVVTAVVEEIEEEDGDGQAVIESSEQKDVQDFTDKCKDRFNSMEALQKLAASEEEAEKHLKEQQLENLKQYVLNCDSFSKLTLHPHDKLLESDSGESSSSVSDGGDDNDNNKRASQATEAGKDKKHKKKVKSAAAGGNSGNQFNELEEVDLLDVSLLNQGGQGPIENEVQKDACQKEMSKLIKIEQIFFRRQPSIDYRGQNAAGGGQSMNFDLFRIETADFPMKLVTHALIEETKEATTSLDIATSIDPSNPDYQKFLMMGLRPQNQGTPRFPTDEEIEAEERRLLLSFAFKDADEIEKYRKEMNHVISQEFIVERPPEAKYRELKYQLRRFEPSTKKTLIFCGIDGLFMFSTQAQIVKTCDRQVKIRKDGIKRRYKIFFRPHLYTFLKTLSQYFELLLYLSEEERVASQWVHVLNSFSIENAASNKAEQSAGGQVDINNGGGNVPRQNGLKMAIKRKQTITEKFFDIILTREHCINDKSVKVAIRNKDLLLEGRSIKNLLFIGTDLKDAMLVKDNAIIVRPYHGNKYENTLAKLKIYLLKYILECGDVRDIIKRDFLCHLRPPNLQTKIEVAVAQKVNTKVQKLQQTVASQTKNHSNASQSLPQQH